jgi:hypothetical protein
VQERTPPIATQLHREEERKKLLESRGVTVITTSGTLATLLLGLTAIASQAKSTFTLRADAKLPLAIALGAFVLASLLAIYTNKPLEYDEARIEGVRKMIREKWDVAEAEALKDVAMNQLGVLAKAKSNHATKAWVLVFAMVAEAAAVFSLFASMLAILY